MPVRRDDEPDKKSVSFVIHTFDRGGSGRVAAYLARGFSDAGMRVALIVFAKGGEVEEIATELAGRDVQIQYLGQGSGVRPWDFIRGLPKLVRLLKRNRPDIVISCANNASIGTAVAFRVATLSDGKLYLKTTNPIASSRHKGVIKRLRRLGYRAIFPWVDAVWTLSAEESGEMRDAFPAYEALFQDVANPYVTPSMFVASAKPRRADDVGKTVIAVARLTAQKRLDRLIEAFALVKHPQARLLILGEGEDREPLERLVARRGMQRRVSMPGYVSDVASALHAADLFVLTSDYEGLPAVVLEAMATNCPVLGTDCFPAARSLLGATQGCAIIEQTDPVSLGALIDRHLELPRPTHLRAIAERYSIENGIESHLKAALSG